MKHQRQTLGWTLAATTLLTLAACGGGGGGDSTPATTATTTTFSGTAATGKALANAAVTITCAAGAGSTTTSATGTYSTAITSVTLPCALKAAGTDGTVLYSVTTATATGPNTQTANITPLTQLMVASLSGTEPASFFTNFNATTAAAVTTTSIAAAQTAVLGLLTQAGVSTTGVTDVIAGSLTAGSGTGYDGVLDKLQTQLAGSGTTLATLTTTVVATSPTATAPGTTVADHTPRLPADLLLKTAASNCAALRSGVYRSIDPQKDSDLAHEIDEITIDAATFTVTDADGTKSTMAPNGNCRYTDSDGDYVVSQGGVILGSYLDNSGPSFGINIPKQSITVAELAGSWNAIGFEKNDGGTAYVGTTVAADISATGLVTNVSFCTSATTCASPTTTLNFTSHADGGFNFVGSGTDNWTDRAFAYRSGSGDLMLITIAGNGDFNIWTKKRTLTLPTVGQVIAASHSIRINNNMVVTTVDDSPAGSIFAVDATTSTVTRNQNQTNGVSYKDEVIYNQPRAGYQSRLAATAPGSDGSTITIRSRTSLGVAGMGVSFQLYPQINSFQAIVER